MRLVNWLIINKNGIKGIRKTKPTLDWDELAIKINMEIPKELFERPQLEANLKIEDIPNNSYNTDILISTQELIEQETKANIDFKIIKEEIDNK